MSSDVHFPTKENIREGLVVLVDGYQVGMTVIAFAAGIGSVEPFIHLNPLSAYYYTNAYRWTLRYVSMIPFWMSGHWGNYCESHKVWMRRFYYMDQFIPPWLRNLFPYVDKKEWKKEEKEFQRFKKYAESAFGKHYRFPTKKFKDFASELTKETVEGLDASSHSMS
ncbi:hypothetical protein O3G_MSEX004501 [Manduca sexta]|nr:hypothetical protein O3G_MSEX004501 [Manduca sexta]